MRWRQSLCVLLLVASATACASAKIGYDYDPNANFNAYHTYDWVSDKQETTGDRRVDNSQVDIRIRTAVAAQLHLKGYMMPANGQPDFYVAYHLGVKEMNLGTSAQYTEGRAGNPIMYAPDSRLAGSAHMTDSDKSYMTGTLMVDIIDAASNKLVWRGTAAGLVDPGLTSEEREERTRTIVREMLSHFPPN